MTGDFFGIQAEKVGKYFLPDVNPEIRRTVIFVLSLLAGAQD